MSREEWHDLVEKIRREQDTLKREIADLKHLAMFWFIEAKGYRPPHDDEDVLLLARSEMEDDGA